MGIVQMYVNNSWQNLLYIPQMLNLKTFHSFSHFQLHVLLHLIFFYMRSFSNIAVCEWFSWCWAFFFLFFFCLLLKLLECHKYYFYNWTSDGLLELTMSVSSVICCCCAMSLLVDCAKCVWRMFSSLTCSDIFLFIHTGFIAETFSKFWRQPRRNFNGSPGSRSKTAPIDCIGYRIRPQKQFPGMYKVRDDNLNTEGLY